MSESFDAHRELFELTRAFRQHLAWQQHAGRYGVVDAPTRRPEDVPAGALDEAAARATPGRAGASRAVADAAAAGDAPRERADSAPVSSETGPRRYGDVTPHDALGFPSMSEALAHMLGDDKPPRPARAAAPAAASTPAISPPTGNPPTGNPVSPRPPAPGPGSSRVERPSPTPTRPPPPMEIPHFDDARAHEPHFDEPRLASPPVTAAAQHEARARLPGPPEPRLTLAEVRAELGECTRCKLAPTRTNIVFGVGDPDAALMFIGEGPGHNEDLRGEPFVGDAGHLLNKMIAAMGWSRDTVYIANVVKCRPPNNRDPHPDEVAACQPFLAKQIAAVRPQMIVTLGRPAAHLVLRTNAPLRRLRGGFKRYGDIAVMPTYHPAYLLRRPQEKGAAWNDLKQVMAALQRMGVSPPRVPGG